ncbi:helix-turn-helix domain-containing protein [Nocardia salmonicida]|uniref:helix-turn-helix domain-containing protein n=1 Tax=Nocardia salmonicida TaxID=53431 RepID=UPI0034116BE2
MALPMYLGLGAFVRERRAAATPPITRAQLAQRAGVALDTLKAIEQGVRPVSVENLEALAKALELPLQLREHLVRLALPGFFAPDMPEGLEGQPAPTAVFPHDRLDLDSTGHAVSFEVHPTFDIIATNYSMEALYPGLTEAGNGIIWMFTNPRAEEIIVEWEMAAMQVIGITKYLSGGVVHPLHLHNIHMACGKNPKWKELWNSEEVPNVVSNDIVRLRVNGVEKKFVRRIDRPWFPARGWIRNRLIELPATPQQAKPFYYDGI